MVRREGKRTVSRIALRPGALCCASVSGSAVESSPRRSAPTGVHLVFRPRCHVLRSSGRREVRYGPQDHEDLSVPTPQRTAFLGGGATAARGLIWASLSEGRNSAMEEKGNPEEKPVRRLDRRNFLKAVMGTGGVLILNACSPTPAPSPTAAPASGGAAPAPTQAPGVAPTAAAKHAASASKPLV